jgi:DNA repair protein RecO (recombination protein O)
VNQIVDNAIVLGRTNYGEADRILTVLTPQHGKVRLMAKGVRRVKSKLAGGIELFSVSTITFVRGRGEIGTLVSTRLVVHYGEIVKDLGRTQAAYDFIKQLNKMTEDEAEDAYFYLLEHIFDALNTPAINVILIRCWFAAHILRLGGHTPNLQRDTNSNVLDASQEYNFDFAQMCFAKSSHGRFSAEHIKLLRLLFGDATPTALQRIAGVNELAEMLAPLLQTMRESSL